MINPGSSSASIEITGVDDDGRAPPLGGVSLNLGAGMARILTASQIENGGSGLTGGLGPGSGKWRLSVSADRPIQVMSLLELPTGHLTNLSRGHLSRGQDGISFAPPPPPPPPGEPDLVVQSPSVNDASLNASQMFRFTATVRNQGGAQAAGTRLRVYRSLDATITRTDAEYIWAPVDALPASGSSDKTFPLSAPSVAGTYYYGACVDTVPGESDTANNCSSAVRVTVGGSGISIGAIAFGWQGQFCENGFGWSFALNAPDVATARSRAESACRSLGLNRCAWVVNFPECGALAFGETSTRCGPRGGHGATKFAAEQLALSRCRTQYSGCRIPVTSAGSRASYCNAGAGATLPADRQSASHATNSSLESTNSESQFRSRPVP